MSHPNGPPRRVSLGYILGFGDKPFKDPKPPSPPRPRRPSQLTELVTSHGGIVEWTASDGRKGALNRASKPRLTAASLAKVPSSTRSAKHPTTAKDGSKKAGSNKNINDLVDTWNALNPGFEGNGGSKKSGSKQAPSNKEDAWGASPWDGGGSTKASQKAASAIAGVTNSGDVNDAWGPQVIATGGETKQSEKDGKSEVKAVQPPKKSVDAIATVAPGDNTVVKDDTKKPDDSNTWTKEQDEKMLQMKTEDASMAWKIIAENVGKTMNQCRERWKVIVPPGWKPNDAKKKADKGDASKKANTTNHGEKGTNSVNESKGSDKKENKDEGDLWGCLGGFVNENSNDKQDQEKKVSEWDNWNNLGDAKTSGWDATIIGDAGGTKDDNNNSSWGNWDGAGDVNNNDTDSPWDQTASGDPTPNDWDTPNQQSKGNTSSGVQASNAQEWPSAAKPASTPRSNKAPSESRSHRTHMSKSKPAPNSSAEIELEPDDNFSADDLRLIARILQQDCSLVWNRVSWRFRDKTGRTLHPDLFEKKITGTVESKKHDS